MQIHFVTSFIYSSESGYRDQSGRFVEDVKVIAYRQTYETPYIGLVGRLAWQDWTLESRFKYSQWVKARDFDNHYLRNTTFTGRHGNSGKMQSLALGLAYRLDEQLSLKAGVDYQVFGEAKGSTLIRDNGQGLTELDGGDASSQSSRTLVSSVALTYRF